MSSVSAPEAAGDAVHASRSGLDWRVIRKFSRFSSGFWRGESAPLAWGLTVALVVLLALSTFATVLLNHWTRWFFDALERKDAAALWHAVLLFAPIIVMMAAIGVGIVLSRETLQVRWRAWIVAAVVERWLGQQRFYHMALHQTQPANPEYRIADDSRWASEPLVDLGIGLVMATFAAGAFISILWTVGGSLTIPLAGSSITIPAYMVLVALAFGTIASLLTMWVGRPLPGLVARKNEAEGDFRFALMRVRDNTEPIALMRGEQAERSLLGRTYGTVLAGWMGIVWRHGRLTWITNSVGPMVPVVPLLFAAPKYLAGELTLGQVTQLAAAFAQVQMAISWIVDNYNRIAEWLASARRVLEMLEASEDIDQRLAGAGQSIRVEPGPPGLLSIEAVRIDDPQGRALVGATSLVARAGETRAIIGDTSVGKTALVRAIAGLWRSGGGTVRLPDGARLAVVPQAGYMPLTTLREALTYPDEALAAPPEPEAIREVLDAVGLARLLDQLDAKGRSEHALSAGERQRFAIARILLQAPDIIVLDDAMTALTEDAQAELLNLLRGRLPHAIILTLGQNLPPRLSAANGMRLERSSGGAVLRACGPERSPAAARVSEPAEV